jgi:hypothetical protein
MGSPKEQNLVQKKNKDIYATVSRKKESKKEAFKRW